MRLEIAGKQALKYSCLNFHYAKVLPAGYIGYSVFNYKNEWCGCILFSKGSCPYLGSGFTNINGEIVELVRVALNGKQEKTSKALSIAIRLFKKKNPHIKAIISFADKGQNHLGILYQATNWIYLGESKSINTDYFYNGKWRHSRALNNKKLEFRKTLIKRKRSGKYKYIYPFDNEIRKLAEKIKKPYPKNASIV